VAIKKLDDLTLASDRRSPRQRHGHYYLLFDAESRKDGRLLIEHGRPR